MASTSNPAGRLGVRRVYGLIGALLWVGQPGAAAAAVSQITGLSDVSFANLDPAVSASSSQSVCVTSTSFRYSVTAAGSGSGSAFTLAAGGSVPALPYSVLWSASPNQTTGTALSPGAPLNGQTTLVDTLLCALGVGPSASLTVSLAASDLQGAVSGVAYSGVLTLTVAAQ